MPSGMMIKGKWIPNWDLSDSSGQFKEKPTTFRDRVTATVQAGLRQSQGDITFTYLWPKYRTKIEGIVESHPH